MLLALTFYLGLIFFILFLNSLGIAVSQVRTPLTGVAKENANRVIKLPKYKRNIRTFLTTANLIECGFLKLGARTTPQSKASTSKPAVKRASRKRKGKEPTRDRESECPLYSLHFILFTFIVRYSFVYTTQIHSAYICHLYSHLC